MTGDLNCPRNWRRVKEADVETELETWDVFTVGSKWLFSMAQKLDDCGSETRWVCEF